MSRLLNFYGSFDKPVPEHTGGETRELRCDLAIIGGGGAGLSAAVRAAELGARVVLVEKMTELGGNTRLAGGLLCTNSAILQKAGVPDTTQAHIDAYRRQHKYQLDPAIYERFIRNTGRFYDWIVGKGMDAENRRVIMDKVVMIRDRSVWEPLRNPAYGPGLMGSAVTDTLIRHAGESESITVLTETAVTEILGDGFGSVTGLYASGKGIDWTIEADNIILATGGFGCDNELLQKYFPQYFTSDNYFTHYCLNHCTGDGIRLAEAVGAKTGENMSIGLEAMVHMPGAYTLQRVTVQPHGVVVGGSGRRFLAENDMDNGEFVMDAQTNGLGWYLFSEDMKDKLYQIAVDNSRYGDWMPEVETFHQDIESELALGLVVRGESIEALADGIGAPADALRETFARYDGFCEAGVDEDFGKAAEYLLPLGTTGPWYAVRLVRKFDVTMGGVSIDAKCRALRPDGSVIRGLYVCGDIASNWMGTDYGPLFSSFAWAVNSGMLTAEECIKPAPQEEQSEAAPEPELPTPPAAQPDDRQGKTLLGKLFGKA